MMRKSVFDIFCHVSVWYKPSRYFQIRNKKLIGRSLDVFLQKRGMSENKNCRNRGMTFVLWILVPNRGIVHVNNFVDTFC